MATPRLAVSEKIFPALTKRERENLQLIVLGSTNSDLAWELILSVLKSV